MNQYNSKHIMKTHMDGKGFGIIATKNLKRFTIILTDVSIINKSVIYDAETHNEAEIIELYMVAHLLNPENVDAMTKFSKLSPHTLDEHVISKKEISKRIDGLKNKKIKDLLSQHTIDNIRLCVEKYKRNAFNIDNTHKTIVPGIFVNGAIFNHSCDPNISFIYFNDMMYYFLNRDVTRGEELTDSYIDVACSREVRQIVLLDRYNFVCECNTCTNKKNIGKNKLTMLKYCKTNDVCKNLIY